MSGNGQVMSGQVRYGLVMPIKANKGYNFNLWTDQRTDKLRYRAARAAKNPRFLSGSSQVGSVSGF